MVEDEARRLHLIILKVFANKGEGKFTMIAAKFGTPCRILSLIFLSLLLCACKTSNTNTTVEQEVSSEYPAYVQMYLQIINNDDMEKNKFSLIYLDDDDIPELVIFDGYSSKYSIYTIKDGDIKCLVDSMITVEMTYYERKNIISTFYRWNGGGDEGGYSREYYQMGQYFEVLTDDYTPSLQIIYNAVYNENGEWSGTGITNYYEKGKEIDEVTYNQIIAEFNIAQDKRITPIFIDKGGFICIE